MNANITNIFGAHLCKTNGWNGDFSHIKIDGIRFDKESQEYIFSGLTYWKIEVKIYVPAVIINELLETGSAIISTEIDHCTIVDKFELHIC